MVERVRERHHRKDPTTRHYPERGNGGTRSTRSYHNSRKFTLAEVRNKIVSTYLSLRYHLIFATKDRQPIIASIWRENLHRYLGGIVKNLEGNAHKVGGTDDHVHLLVELRATHALADFMRNLKRASSSWVHTEVPLETFAWQEGYAAITVSPSALDEVRRYIENQEEHHRARDSREELRLLLERAGIQFDERFFA